MPKKVGVPVVLTFVFAMIASYALAQEGEAIARRAERRADNRNARPVVVEELPAPVVYEQPGMPVVVQEPGANEVVEEGQASMVIDEPQTGIGYDQRDRW